MPDAKPLSASTHWWSDSAAMFITQDPWQLDGISIAGQAKRFAASFESPDAGDAAPRR